MRAGKAWSKKREAFAEKGGGGEEAGPIGRVVTGRAWKTVSLKVQKDVCMGTGDSAS